MSKDMNKEKIVGIKADGMNWQVGFKGVKEIYEWSDSGQGVGEVIFYFVIEFEHGNRLFVSKNVPHIVWTEE